MRNMKLVSLVCFFAMFTAFSGYSFAGKKVHDKITENKGECEKLDSSDVNERIKAAANCSNQKALYYSGQFDTDMTVRAVSMSMITNENLRQILHKYLQPKKRKGYVVSLGESDSQYLLRILGYNKQELYKFDLNEDRLKESKKIVRILNKHRKKHGLYEIPYSYQLSQVSYVHAQDSEKNPFKKSMKLKMDGKKIPKDVCTPHSWSGDGPWKACCHNHLRTGERCGEIKPSEITKSYDAPGYEITRFGGVSFAGDELSYSDLDPMIPRDVLGFKKSPPHYNMMMNKTKMWKSVTWRAVGAAISDEGHYMHVWFGEEVDPLTAPPPKDDSDISAAVSLAKIAEKKGECKNLDNPDFRERMVAAANCTDPKALYYSARNDPYIPVRFVSMSIIPSEELKKVLYYYLDDDETISTTDRRHLRKSLGLSETAFVAPLTPSILKNIRSSKKPAVIVLSADTCQTDHLISGLVNLLPASMKVYEFDIDRGGAQLIVELFPKIRKFSAPALIIQDAQGKAHLYGGEPTFKALVKALRENGIKPRIRGPKKGRVTKAEVKAKAKSYEPKMHWLTPEDLESISSSDEPAIVMVLNEGSADSITLKTWLWKLLPPDFTVYILAPLHTPKFGQLSLDVYKKYKSNISAGFTIPFPSLFIKNKKGKWSFHRGLPNIKRLMRLFKKSGIKLR